MGPIIIVTSESGRIPEKFCVARAQMNTTLSTILPNFDLAWKEVFASHFQLKLKKMIVFSRIIREIEK